MRGLTNEKEKCLKKLNEMQTFLPFLDFMIDKIKKNHVLPLECQLSKFQYIRSLIVEKNRRYSLEGLTNIEDVLQKLIIKLDHKGLIPKDSKESLTVKLKSTSSKEVLLKSNNESGNIPKCSVPTAEIPSSNDCPPNTNDPPSGRINILVKSQIMPVGQDSPNNDTNATTTCLSTAVGFTQRSGRGDSEEADKNESEVCIKATEGISLEAVGNAENSTPSDVLKSSREKLLKSVSGKGVGADNNGESDVKAAVHSDSSKDVGSSVPDGKRTNCDPINGDEKAKEKKSDSLKNDSVSNKVADISDEEHGINGKSRSNGKHASTVNGDIRKRTKPSADNYGTNGETVNRDDVKCNDNFVIGNLSNSPFEFSNKQKLRERLSADIAEVHKVPGRSIGGSLRSLKDVKTSSQESDLTKPDKTTESHSSDVKKTSSKDRSDHRRSSHEGKHGHPKKESNAEDSKGGRKESGRDSNRREKWRHERRGSDQKNKSDAGRSSSKSASVSNSSKEKKGKGKKESEIDKLNDHELAAIVKENISAFPNLSKLKPDELRRVAKSSLSLSSEDLNPDEKSGLDQEENTGKKSLPEQGLNSKTVQEKSKNDSSHQSPPRTDDKISEVSADPNSVQAAAAKDNSKSVLNAEVRPEFENNKTVVEESVYSPGILLSSNQVDSRNNVSLPELHIHEDFNALDQRLKHSATIASDNRYVMTDPRMQNWMQNAEMNQTESFIPPRFATMYNDRNNSDLRARNMNFCYEAAYYGRPYFPVQGNNRFYAYESVPYDVSGSVNRRYGMTGDPARFFGYNMGRNPNFSMPEPKSYGEYKELKRQEMEIMNRYRLANRDMPNSADLGSEDEFLEKSKVPVNYFGSKSMDDGKNKHSLKSLAPAKDKDFRDTKPYRPKTGKPVPKYRNSFEDDKRARDDKSPESKKSSAEDELISPLEKLYDNNPKPVTGRGYGLQNFKIPKKDTSAFSKSHKSHASEKETKQRPYYKNKFDTETTSKENTEKENANKKRNADDGDGGDGECKIAVNGQQNGDLDASTKVEHVNKNRPEVTVEPAESANGSSLHVNGIDVNKKKTEPEVGEDTPRPQKSLSTSLNLEDLSVSANGDKCDNGIEMTEPPEEKAQKESDANSKTSITEEITQELVESLIKKSFESGEGELLLAKAKLFKELATKLNSKKLKTIQKIINSESDTSSSSSDVSEVDERKKKKKKKKDFDHTPEKWKSKKSKKQKKKQSSKSRKISDSSGDETSAENTENLADHISTDKCDSAVSDSQVDHKDKEAESPDKNSKASKRKTKLLEQVLNESPSKDLDLGAVTSQTSSDKETEQKAKAKGKAKGKTELDRLHDDIRSMFIASGVVTATGLRMCRILRESGGKMNNLDLVKESAKMIEEEKLASRKTRKRSIAQTKGGKNKSNDQKARKEKPKNNKRMKIENPKVSNGETRKNPDPDIMNMLNDPSFQPKVVLQRMDLKKLCYAYKIEGFPESYTRKRGLNVAKRGTFERGKKARTSNNYWSVDQMISDDEAALARKGKIYLVRNIRKYFALRNSPLKKVCKPKNLSNVIDNLKANKFRHFDFGMKDDTQKEDTLRQLFSPNVEPNRIGNILKRDDILNYAFDRNTTVFYCLLCDYNTKAITDHYLQQHPASEVLISRLALPEARKAIRNSEDNQYNVTAPDNADKSDNLTEETTPKPDGGKSNTAKGDITPKPPGAHVYLCRMCNNGSIPTLCQFFSHVSTHTGEYRFRCPIEGCILSMADRESVKIHVNWKHQENKHQASNAVELFPLPADNGILFGYLCSHCNFVQIIRKNVETHVVNQHAGVEDVRIIKIDMSRQIEKEKPKKRKKKKKDVHNEEEGTDDKGLSTRNEGDGLEVETDNEEDEYDSCEESSSNSGIEDKELSCSSSMENLSLHVEDLGTHVEDLGTHVEDLGTHVEDLGTHVEDLGTQVVDLGTQVVDLNAQMGDLGTQVGDLNAQVGDLSTQMEDLSTQVGDLSVQVQDQDEGEKSESDTQNTGTRIQQDDVDTQANDSSIVAVENAVVEESTALDIFDPMMSSFVGCEVDVTIDEMEQVNCFEIIQTEEDISIGNELVEEVVINMEIEGPGIMIADEVADTTIEKCWEVGPLKALMFENEFILYMCTELDCQFSTKMFDDLEDHMTMSHNSDSWDGICKTCRDFPERKVESPGEAGGLLQILDHLESHIKMEAGEDAVKKVKPDDIIIYEHQILEAVEQDEIDSVTIGGKFEGLPYPPKPLLRVRNFTGDRLSRPKYPDEDHSYTESPCTVSDAYDDDEKESTEPLFKIKDVRSLNPDSKDQTSTADTIFASQNITVKKFPPNAEVVSGKPVLVRSCPSPKITIIPENTVSIPIAQGKKPAGVGHLKVVPPRTDAGATDVKKRQLAPKPKIRILTPANFKSTLVPVSKSIDTVVTSSQNKARTVKAVVKKPCQGSGVIVKDRTISTTSAVATNVQKKKTILTPPLISLSKPFLRSPPKEQTPKLSHISPRSQQLYSISFGGKNIKDAKVYEEMLKKKKICQLFKCMAVECSFTCNSDAIFTQHIGLHDAQQRIKGKKKPQSRIRKIYNWQQCAYCCEVLVQTGSALSQHILTEHGHCLYQCAYCFYRAVSGIYVAIHQNTVHEKLLRRKKKKLMYKCQPVPGASMSKQFEKQIKPHTVRPYQCEICGFKFFIIRHFLDHLTKQHLAVTAYACHICKILCFKADRLIAHYKLHSYNLFQCSYCLHGTDTQKEMLSHLCNFHFSQPPILYARMIDEVSSIPNRKIIREYKQQNGNNVFFDDLKIINLENAQCDTDCIVEEVGAEDMEELEMDSEGVQPMPISVDLSAIASELGINIEGGDSSSLGKVLMDMESDFSRLVPVETILPNAKFSSDTDIVCEDNSSFLVASEYKTGRSNRDEKEASVPLGQLPIEFLTLETKAQSSAAETPSVSEHLASIAEGIEKLQQNNCQVIISTVPEKKSVDEMPTRTMHKLPPTIPINRSGVNNVFQSKKNVTRNLENIPRQTKEGVPALIKRTVPSHKFSTNFAPQIERSVLVAYSGENKLSNRKKETGRLSTVPNIMSLKRHGSRFRLESPGKNKCEINPAKRPRMSSGPLRNLIARNSCQESSLMISDIRSLSTEKTTLQPPIIRVEDFANDEKGNLVRKKECLSVEVKKDPSDCDKEVNSVSVNSNYYPDTPFSPEVIIIDFDGPENNPDKDFMEVVDSGEVEPTKSNNNGDTEKNNKLERAENNENDNDGNNDEEEEEDHDDDNDDNDDEDDRDEDGDDEEDDQDDDDEDEDDDDEDEEEDVEIRKEMEQLRSQIEHETDCLLVEVSSQQNDPLTRSELSEISKVCFPTDGEALLSFDEASQSADADNADKATEEPSGENAAETSQTVTEINENGTNKTSSDEVKEDEQALEMQIRSGSRNRAVQAQKKPKANSPKGKELSGKELYLCGIANCNFSAENCKELKDHLCVCDLSRDSSILSCPHCSRQFKQTMSYLEHLKIHGEKKYSCGLCNFCSTTENNVNRHLKQKHKCSQTKTLPNDSLKPGYFAVYPKNYKVEKQSEVTNVYSPGDEDKLPLQSIYQDNVKCSQCPYFTKVRSNMVRHLKIHIKSVETEGSIVVPKTAPTNPVPCLDAKERMFDKMANLAASSQLAHANKEKKNSLPPEEKAKLPQFVPEQMRYKCCSPDCNYLTVDDNMLKHHIKALHDEINVYSCPHCRESVHVEFRFAPLDKIGQHLKYHDSKLYKCCHCLYFHYQKYVVEKHMLEKHPERRFFVYTIREPKVESGTEEEHPSHVESVVKLWKCGLCDDFERPARPEVVDHLAKVHNMKSKFKCKHCDMKSSQYSSFVSHFASKHPGLKVECLRSIIQVNRTSSGGSQCVASQESSTEYFDTTPLWQRDAPRVRHIRGILIEEEEVKKKRTKKVGSNATNETNETNETASTSAFPLDSFYCPLCADKKKLFRTKSAEVFRNHLYQELNYQQYACTLCGKMFVDKKEYERHHLRSHPNKNPSFNRTKEDSEIKFWVQKVVLKQEMQLKDKKKKMGTEAGAAQSSKKKKVVAEEDQAATEEKPEESKPETSCSCSKVENTETEENVSGENTDFARPVRSPDDAQEEPATANRPDPKPERNEQKPYAKQELKWLCHYCKEFFQTEDEAVTHSKNNHADNPIKTMLVPEEETGEPIDDLWLIEYSQDPESDSESVASDGTPKKKARRGSSYTCGYCMIEVTDQTSIVNHFETFHKSSHSMARVGMVGTIYYRCNVCLEKLLSFSSLNVHANQCHPNMTLQFEIRKIYKYDTVGKDSETAKAAMAKAKDGSYQCPRCPSISSSYLDCIDHFNEHYPRYTCGSCSVRYYTVREIEHHQNEAMHSIPYSMTIPSEKMLDEYKAGITIKKNGEWLPLQDHARSEVTDEGTDARRPRPMTARKSTTQVPERRNNGDEASAARPRNAPSN